MEPCSNHAPIIPQPCPKHVLCLDHAPTLPKLVCPNHASTVPQPSPNHALCLNLSQSRFGRLPNYRAPTLDT